MWQLVGMTILLSHAALANINEENFYYPIEAFADPRETRMDFGNPRARIFGETEGRTKQVENASAMNEPRNRRDPEGSIADEDLGEERHRRIPGAPVMSLLHWPPVSHERIGATENFQSRPIEVRQRSFAPWGGKRNLESYRTIAKIRRPVRVPFNSWGGKRSEQAATRIRLDQSKRDKLLASWQGKKSPPFNSWGGKRASIDFSSDYDSPAGQSEQLVQIHRQLYGFDSLSNPAERGERPIGDLMDTGSKKRASSKLVGSEITTSSSTIGSEFPRVPFEPWGGKRRGQVTFDDDDNDDDSAASPSVSLIFRKIGQTVPWNI